MTRTRRLHLSAPEHRRLRNTVRCAVLGVAVLALLGAHLSHTPSAASDVLSVEWEIKDVEQYTPDVLDGRRQLKVQKGSCEKRFSSNCTGGLCPENDEIDGACCFNVVADNLTAALECHTRDGHTCAFKDLCVAELIPGSGVGAQCLQAFEKDDGIAIYVFLLVYLFIALAIVCDDYFTYSLDCLGDLLGMSSDVKGATFAAMGSSAPELFVSLADNVITNPPKSVGVGTIVGSAIFNILIIIGASAIVAGAKFHKGLDLDWRPLVRDSLFYVISIIALVGTAVTDNSARWYEGLILLICYGFYLLFMAYNRAIFDRVDRFLGLGKYKKDKDGAAETADAKGAGELAMLPAAETETNLPPHLAKSTPLMKEDAESGVDKDVATLDKAESAATLKKAHTSPSRRSSIKSINLGGANLEQEVGSYFENLFWPMVPLEGDESGSFIHRALCGGLSMWARRVYYVLVLPINICFKLTIPDAKHDLLGEDYEDKKTGQMVTDKRRWLYWIEFIACILWIAVLSQLLVFSASKFGCLVGIAPSVMGLTVLAAGTSVPDAITSVILTQNGEGDAAVANSIGSNVFDILVGLGLPWLLSESIYGVPAGVATDDVGISIGFLFGVLILLIGGLFLTKFKLTTAFGVALCLLYVLYVVFELLIAS